MFVPDVLHAISGGTATLEIERAATSVLFESASVDAMASGIEHGHILDVLVTMMMISSGGEREVTIPFKAS